jgi:sRNA-binding carbon storage regulator CsrA
MPELNRKQQLSIAIDEEACRDNVLKVTVLENRDGRVTLGLNVPAGTCVQRREVVESINDNDVVDVTREIRKCWS